MTQIRIMKNERGTYSIFVTLGDGSTDEVYASRSLEKIQRVAAAMVRALRFACPNQRTELVQ